MNIERAFEIIGIPPTATMQEVSNAYKTLARAAHPDGGGSADAFYELNTAYQIVAEFVRSAPCPDCIGGYRARSRGFAHVQVVCDTCNGTGRRTR